MDAARQKTTSESESQLEEDINNNNLPPPPPKNEKEKYRAVWEKECVAREHKGRRVQGKLNCLPPTIQFQFQFQLVTEE